MPLISIIVPVYNLELYIKKCIDSILAQTFTNFEVILVNDGSTDNSGDICDEYAQKDNRVIVIHKDYGGVSSARNIGVEIARGEYIGFVDGDDWIDKNMYQKLYTLCSETSSDISICKLGREINGEIINKNEKEFIKEMDNFESMRQLFKGVFYRFSLCNKLFRKSCFRSNIKFPEGRIHEDLSTTYRLVANANKAVYTSYIGYIYVKRENSILSSKYYEARLDAFRGWEEILPFMNENYEQISKEFITCFAYGCIDNIYYVLNQVENSNDKKRYLNIIRDYLRKNYKRIMIESTLTPKQKYIVAIINYDIKLLLILNTFKRFLKAHKRSNSKNK